MQTEVKSTDSQKDKNIQTSTSGGALPASKPETLWLFSAPVGPRLFNHLQFMRRVYFVSNGNQTSSTLEWLKINTRSEETLLLIVQASVLRWP